MSTDTDPSSFSPSLVIRYVKRSVGVELFWVGGVVVREGDHLRLGGGGKTLADSLEDGVVLNVVRVVGLQLAGNAGERTLQGLLGGSVNHLGLLAEVS